MTTPEIKTGQFYLDPSWGGFIRYILAVGTWVSYCNLRPARIGSQPGWWCPDKSICLCTRPALLVGHVLMSADEVASNDLRGKVGSILTDTAVEAGKTDPTHIDILVNSAEDHRLIEVLTARGYDCRARPPALEDEAAMMKRLARVDAPSRT